MQNSELAQPPADEQQANTIDDAPQTFYRDPAIGRKVTMTAIGTAAGFAIAIVGFIVCLVVDVDPIAMNMMTTAPAMWGIFCAVRLSSLAGSWQTVNVDANGITATRGSKSQHVAWQDVGNVKREDGSILGSDIQLLNTRGKKLLTISDSITDNKTLEAIIKQKVAERDDDVAEKVERKNLRKQGLILVTCGFVMLMAGLGGVYMAIAEMNDASQFESSAVEGVGVITDLVVAPNGFTKRVYYTIEGDAGQSADHNVEVKDEHWQLLKVGQQVPVRYVPAKPGIALMKGEVRSNSPMDEPWTMVLAGGFLACLGLAGLGVGIASWMGFDVDKMLGMKK